MFLPEYVNGNLEKIITNNPQIKFIMLSDNPIGAVSHFTDNHQTAIDKQETRNLTEIFIQQLDRVFGNYEEKLDNFYYMTVNRETVYFPFTGQLYEKRFRATGDAWSLEHNDMELAVRYSTIIPGSLWASTQALLNFICR